METDFLYSLTEEDSILYKIDIKEKNSFNNTTLQHSFCCVTLSASDDSIDVSYTSTPNSSAVFKNDVEWTGFDEYTFGTHLKIIINNLVIDNGEDPDFSSFQVNFEPLSSMPPLSACSGVFW